MVVQFPDLVVDGRIVWVRYCHYEILSPSEAYKILLSQKKSYFCSLLFTFYLGFKYILLSVTIF